MASKALQKPVQQVLAVIVLLLPGMLLVTGNAAANTGKNALAEKRAPVNKKQTAQRYLAWFKTSKVMTGSVLLSRIKNGESPLVELNYPVSNFDHPWVYQVRVRLDTRITKKQLAAIKQFNKKHKYEMTLYVVITDTSGRDYTGRLLGYGKYPVRRRDRKPSLPYEFDSLDINPEVFIPLID